MNRRIWMWMLTFLLLFACACEKKPVSSASEDNNRFCITMLDVGQGLSILVEADGQYLLYDGGGRECSSYVVAKLKEAGIERLDYMIVSHYDSDHLSGLVGVLNTTEVLQVLEPGYTAEGYLFESYRKKKEEKNVPCTIPKAGDVFCMGRAEIQVLAADPAAIAENNRSLAVRIVYDDFSVLITGDGEYEEEQQMLCSGYDLKSDVLVAGHHGSSSSTSSEFLDAVSPSYVMISAGKDNEYGHPHLSVMNALKKRRILLFRSDLQSEVSMNLENGSLQCSTYPSNDYSGGSQLNREQSEEEGERMAYVLNIHTKKFHLPSCSSVQDMKEQNKRTVEETKEALLEEGYTACESCRP